MIHPMSPPLPPPARKEFERAIALFNEGRLATADGICTDLMAKHPLDAELAHFGGVVANRMGRFEVAAQRLARCVKLEPQRAMAQAALGFAQEQLGRLDEAQASFTAAIRAQPQYGEAYNGLGVTLMRSGRAAEALPAFERALQIDPAAVESWLNTARAYLALGRIGPAAVRFREAARIAMQRDDVLEVSAAGLFQAGDLDASIELYRQLLQRSPGDARTRATFALALDAKGLVDEADTEIRAAMALPSPDAWVRNAFGAILLKRQRYDEAAAELRKAVALDASFGEAAVNLAAALRALGRRDEALAALAGAESRLDAKGLASLASLYSELGDSTRSIVVAQGAVSASPFLQDAHRTLASEFLRARRLDEGWRGYLFRPDRGAEVLDAIARGAYPPPLPSNLQGRTVVILAEQGIGDMLFFLRFAKPLAEAGARLHVRDLDARLMPMVSRSLPMEPWPADRVVDGDAIAIWAGDLPLFVRPLASLCAPFALTPLEDRVTRMRERLGSPSIPRIGVAWRAGTARHAGRFDLVPLLKDMDPAALGEALAGLPLRFVSMQRRPGEGSTAAFERGLGAAVIDCADVNEDLEDTLALLSILEGYVGMSSANIHFLAGLGRTAHVLVPFPPEWRWQESGESQWFKGFATYRQLPDGDWSAALAALRDKISHP
jgi:tetratricopeptide (TPR) repeat protein